MARFVTFPGTAGSYASTDDVNLLDADSAHLQQSIGGWKAYANAATFTHEPSNDALFGTESVQFLATATQGFCEAGTAENLLGAAVVASTQYSAEMQMKESVGVGASFKLAIRWFDVGGTTISDSTGSISSALTTDYGVRTITATSPVGAAFASVIAQGGAVTAGDTFQIKQVCIRAGGSSSFVPSLRIVGDLDQRFTLANAAQGRIMSRWNPNNQANKVFTTQVETNGDITAFFNDQNDTLRTINLASVVTAGQHDYQIIYEMSVEVRALRDTVLIDSSPIGSSTAFANKPAELAVSGQYAGTSNLFTGDVFAASLRDGIEGPIVAVFDADDITI